MLQVPQKWKFKEIENESLVICPALKEYLWYALDTGRIAPLQLSYSPTVGAFPQKGNLWERWSCRTGEQSSTGRRASSRA
jgi:hypothetical protein